MLAFGADPARPHRFRVVRSYSQLKRWAESGTDDRFVGSISLGIPTRHGARGETLRDRNLSPFDIGRAPPFFLKKNFVFMGLLDAFSLAEQASIRILSSCSLFFLRFCHIFLWIPSSRIRWEFHIFLTTTNVHTSAVDPFSTGQGQVRGMGSRGRMGDRFR